MKKSLLKGIILSLFFGPFGLFYSSVVLGIVLVVATPIIGFLSGEVPIGLWPISVVVSIFAVRRHNSRLKQELLRVSLSAENVGQKPVDDKDAGRRAALTASRENAARSQSRKVDRISEKEAALNRGSPGYVDGKHFTTYIEQVKHLKREERHDEAIALLLNLIAATEAESRESGGPSGVAPWYYEQLAIIYRKVKRHSDEVAVLERYEGQTKAPGVGPQRLAERLTKAKEILTKERLKGGSEESEAEQSKLDSRGAQIKTGEASPKSWRLKPEGFEAGQQAEQARQRAKKDKVSSSKQLMSDPLPPIVGTDRIAEILRGARTEKTEPEEKKSVLADFRLVVSPGQSEEPEAESKQLARWVQLGETVTVGNYDIQRGFFYFGGLLKSLRDYDYENDPSLVDPKLEIDADSPDYVGEQMVHWPNYSHISPQCRAAYIEWLASDRSDPETYIGYVFLYFFGIERRLLVDDKEVSDDERYALIQELKRLNNVYGGNRSFNAYVTGLLSHLWILDHISSARSQIHKEQLDKDLLIAKSKFTSVFKFLLANTVHNGDPIDAELALAWVKSHPEFTWRTAVRRCPDEFDALFKLRYQNKFEKSFSDGLNVDADKTRLQLDYFSASLSLRGYHSIKLDLPDVSCLKAPVRKLLALAESCTDELDAFSRFVGRKSHSNDPWRALALLPGELISSSVINQETSVSFSCFERIKARMKTQVSESNGLISVESILQFFGENAPPKVNKKEAELLSNIAEKAGFGIAPDIRFHHAKPDIDGKIVLFAGGHGEGFSPSSEFRKVGTILRLGCLVAVTDDHVSDSEVKALKDVISQDSRLTETEKRSLDAYMLWRLNTPANMSGLKKRLDLLSASEKVAISHILVGVALADGKIDPAEVKQLEKLYTQLGLDKGLVASDIHNLSSTKLKRPEPQDKSSFTVSTQPATSFALDRDLLLLLEEETKEAQSVLESIFAEEDLDEEHEIETPNNVPANNGAIEGLDIQYQELYGRLITKADWTNEELEELCDELQLMTAGAVETINDWAFDRVGAPLIEDGSTVFVDLDLAEEISTMQMQEQMQ